MTKREFVIQLFDWGMDPHLEMDLQTAERDLKYFRRYEWPVPKDLTSEEYMEIWNELRDEYIRNAEEVI